MHFAPTARVAIRYSCGNTAFHIELIAPRGRYCVEGVMHLAVVPSSHAKVCPILRRFPTHETSSRIPRRLSREARERQSGVRDLLPPQFQGGIRFRPREVLLVLHIMSKPRRLYVGFTDDLVGSTHSAETQAH